MVRVRDVAAPVRSRNDEDFRLRLDILFKGEATYHQVITSKAITPELIGCLVGLRPSQITAFVQFGLGLAIKAMIPRPASSGAVGDTDVNCAQQHAPQSDIELLLDDERWAPGKARRWNG